MNNTDSSSTRTSPSLPSSASLSLTSSSSSSSSQIIPSWLAFHRLENEMGDDDGTSSTEDGIDLFGWFGWFLPHAAVVAFFVCITMTWIKLRTICKYMLDSTIGTRRWWWGWRLPFPTGHRRRTRRSNGYDNKNRNDDDRLSIEDRRRILLEDFDSSGHMMVRQPGYHYRGGKIPLCVQQGDCGRAYFLSLFLFTQLFATFPLCDAFGLVWFVLFCDCFSVQK